MRDFLYYHDYRKLKESKEGLRKFNIHRLWAFSFLEDNWDDEGSPKIDEICLSRARSLNLKLKQTCEIFPLKNGGVCLQIDNDDQSVFLIVEINRDFVGYGACYKDGYKIPDTKKPYDEKQLIDFIDAFIEYNNIEKI